MTKRMVCAALAALWSAATLAQTTAAVTDSGWMLGAKQYPDQPSCVAAAGAMPAPLVGKSATYACVDTTTVVLTNPVPPASGAGSFLTGPGSLIDSAGTAWTLNARVVYQQPINTATPVKAGFSANVGVLAWSGGKIHQRNADCLWWDWSGTTWAAEAAPAVAGLPACGAPSSSSSSSSSSGGGSGSSSGSSSSSSGATSSSGGSSSSGAAAFGVRASGGHLVSTLTGTPVELIGLNMSGCETSFSLARCTAIANAGPAFWSGAFKAAHAGTNTVRLPIDAVAWLSNAGGQYQANYKKAVADALAGGLYVIIDQHWSAPNGQSSIGQPGFSDADHGLIFWKQMADLYGGNPAVIFELFNEPFGDNNFNSMVTTEVPIVANGGAFSPFMHQNNAGGGAMLTVQISYQVAGEKTMLAVIRGEGATNLVLASTMGWAGEMQTWLTAYGSVKDANFGASHHAYGWNYGGSVAARQAVLLAIQAAGYPIVTTEFTVGMPTIGGYAFESSHGIGSISWGPNAWGGKPTLSPTGW